MKKLIFSFIIISIISTNIAFAHKMAVPKNNGQVLMVDPEKGVFITFAADVGGKNHRLHLWKYTDGKIEHIGYIHGHDNEDWAGKFKKDRNSN